MFKAIQFKSTIKAMMLALAACCLGCAMFTSCDKNDDDESLKFSPATVNVTVGKTQTVTVKGGTQPFTAKSADEKTATVTVSKDQLTVTGVKAGTTTINVVDKNKLTGALTVKVTAATTKK